MIDNITRRDKGMAYYADEAVLAEMAETRKKVYKLNNADPSDFSLLAELAKELLPNCGENLVIVPPFRCDYGFHIHAGKNFGMNYNCTILDVAEVFIGDNVLFAPNVSIFTAGHPIHPESRITGYEYGIPVHIGSNVWIGGNSVVNPGVTIGEGSVIGSGSVVTKDIPPFVVAAGNPCRVIRKITEADRRFYFKDHEFDSEVWNKIQKQ